MRHCICRHQGFGVLSVALASQAISILSSLIDDLHIEGLSAPPAAAEEREDPALCMQTQYTAQQRVMKITESISLTSLLFTLMSTAYKKVIQYYWKVGNVAFSILRRC